MRKPKEAPMSGLATARAQAAVQQANADAAILANVRERCQEAADSWTKLADRIERVGSVAASDLEKS